MIKDFTFICITLFFMIFSSMSYDSEKIFYTIRHHESLSSILNRLKLNPIYGRNNRLQKTVEYNRLEKDKSGNLIFPDKKIYFEPELRERILEVAEILPSGEVRIKPEVPIAKKAEPNTDRAPSNVVTQKESASDTSSDSDTGFDALALMHWL